MTVHKNVKTVLAQTKAVEGEFRLRELTHVIGESAERSQRIRMSFERGCGEMLFLAKTV